MADSIREKIAQIIDPHSFLPTGMPVDEVDEHILHMVAQGKEDALRKADRILALSGNPVAWALIDKEGVVGVNLEKSSLHSSPLYAGQTTPTPVPDAEAHKRGVEAALAAWLEISAWKGKINGTEFRYMEAAIAAYLGASDAVLCADPVAWQTMDTAPRDGKHCILAVKEGAFICSVQGAFQAGQWNAVHRDNVEPLCWMPNVRLPEAIRDAVTRSPSKTEQE